MSNFGTHKEEFSKTTEKILKEKLSTNQNTLNSYVIELENNFNTVISYCESKYDNLDEDSKSELKEEIVKLKIKLKECIKKLKLNYTLSEDIFEKIKLIINQTSDDTDTSDNIDLSDDTKTMAITAVDFLRLCAQTINKNYAGDPLSLQAFLNSIELLETVQDEHAQTLVKFVMTKLEGKALECVPPKPKELKEITEALQKRIKPDSAKVIESRMSTLRFDSSKLQDYTRELDQLSEALQRALVTEGIPQEKALSMAVEKTVEICRRNAKSDLIKSVIASTSFQEPKEVTAKFSTESSSKDAIATISHFRGNRRKSYNGNFNGNYNRNTYNNRGRGYGGRNRGRGNNNNSRNFWNNKNNNNNQFNSRRNPVHHIQGNSSSPQVLDLEEGAN